MGSTVSRKAILTWLHRAEEDAKRVLSEFPHLDTPPDERNALQSLIERPRLNFTQGMNALRDLINTDKKSLIRSYYEWFRRRFDDGVTPGDLAHSDYELYLESNKGKAAIMALDLISFVRDAIVEIENGDAIVLAENVFFVGYFMGFMDGIEHATSPATMTAWHSKRQSSARKEAHLKASNEKRVLIEQFEGYAKERIAHGFKGSAEKMVRIALSQKQFVDLKNETTTRKNDDTGEILKRATINRRRLLEIASRLLKNATQK